MKLQALFAAVVVLVIGFSLGCKNDNAAISGVNTEDAAKLNASRSPFESSQDPPIAPETRFAAGQLAETQGAPAAAVAQYQLVLKTDPDYVPALYRLGVIFTQAKQYPTALDYWSRYVKATQEAPGAYADLGVCFDLADRPDEAAAAFEKGIARDPKNSPCRVNYGLMLARRGRMAEAAEQWRAALPEADVHYNLGSVYELQGRRQQAKAEYRKALELNPRLADAQSRLARLD